MTLSNDERVAVRSHWLGEALPEALAELLSRRPRDEAERERQREVRHFLHTLSGDTVRHTRRLLLTYGVLAVARLVELMNGESAETSRKAAVDLLRHWDRWAGEELAEDASALAMEHRELTAALTDGQVERLWSILAEGRPGEAAGEVAGAAAAAVARREAAGEDHGDDSDGDDE